MKKSKILALFLALVMLLSLVACGKTETVKEEPTTEEPEAVEESEFFGPIYDEWSEKTEAELYQMAIEEVKEEGPINIYATSSKMLKAEEKWLETYPELEIQIMDMDQDEVLEKCVLEANAGNIMGDVLQAKDVNGEVFFNYYEEGYCSAYYPKDICQLIDEGLLRYGYPLYASQSFWYHTTEALPEGQPVTNWWQIVQTDGDDRQPGRVRLQHCLADEPGSLHRPGELRISVCGGRLQASRGCPPVHPLHHRRRRRQERRPEALLQGRQLACPQRRGWRLEPGLPG